ncbi:MAG: Hdr-like menaquinol oxidoreductase cytochrome c subunit [Gammaproteobacteria bacterium]|nr:Hdr-like menaquinol oxidoreductase cytochrome c subunit [Gammaproteobacteria bacterium]
MKRSISKLQLALLAVMGLALYSQTLISRADVPLPDIPEVPKAKAEQCVEPTEHMRRNHMELILHQRDETMHRGIRTNKYSLKECISCHINPGTDGTYPRVDTQKHFCAACHDYASVKIDCFECHSDVPEPKQ